VVLAPQGLRNNTGRENRTCPEGLQKYGVPASSRRSNVGTTTFFASLLASIAVFL
jgi:hypothetical protein